MAENNVLSGNQWTITKRPQRFDDLYGQDEVVDYFKSLHQKCLPIPNSIWLGGKFGCGKTTIAKIIAKTIQCKNRDKDGNPCGECLSCKSIENETWGRNTIMFNGGTNGTIDEVRRLVDNVNFPPMIDGNWVFMVEEAQEISADGVQALLKTIETPRSNVYFIFTSMEEDAKKLEKFSALISRCDEFKLNTATVMDVMFYLRHVLETENLWSTLPKEFKLEGLKLIATNCRQSYREALKRLQSCVNAGKYSISEISSKFGITPESNVSIAVNDLIKGKWTDAVDSTFVGIPKPKDEKIKKRYPINGMWIDEEMLESNAEYQTALAEMGISMSDLKDTIIKGSSKVLRIREANFKEAFRQVSNIIIKSFAENNRPIPRNIQIVYNGLKSIIDYCSNNYYDYAYCGAEIGLILDKCNAKEKSDNIQNNYIPEKSVKPVSEVNTQSMSKPVEASIVTTVQTDALVTDIPAQVNTEHITPSVRPTVPRTIVERPVAERTSVRTIVRNVQDMPVQTSARIIKRG